MIFQQAIQNLTALNPDLIVTLGTDTTDIVLKTIPDKPVVFGLIANALDVPFLAPDNPARPA